jgi:hypothetical protein
MKEIWKSVPGYEGLYEVSSEGRVKSCERMFVRSNGKPQPIREKTLTPRRGKYGYTYVVLCKPLTKNKTCKVHSLVAAAFIGPRPEGEQCCHNNGVRGDNRLVNLRYATPKENCADRVAHGTHTAGERNGRALVTPEDVKAIRALAGQRTQEQIGRLFGISRSNVSAIVRHETWINS